MTNIYIYSRKSKFTGRGESIDNQIEMCKEYIHYHFDGETEISVFEDEGYSAKNTDRPEYQRMLREMKTNKPDVLICYRLDRISRDVSDFAALYKKLQANNIEFISIRENFDTSTPMGRAMIYNASVFAQLERETIAERIYDNKQRLAYTGRWQGGEPPLGYSTKQMSYQDKDGKNRSCYMLIENPEESSTIRLIYSKYLEFRSLAQLEKYMLVNHIPSRTGKDYHKTVLRQLLTNPTYATNTPAVFEYLKECGTTLANDKDDYDGETGLLSYNRTYTDANGKRQRHKKTEWIIAVGNHKGLIDGDSWTSVQKTIDLNKEKYPRWETSNVALLSGLIRCANCGAPMKVMGNRKTADGKKNYYYVCTKKQQSGGVLCCIKNILGPQFDKAFLLTLKAKFCGDIDGAVKESKHRVSVALSSVQKDIAALEKQIDANDKAIQNLIMRLAETSSRDIDDYINKAVTDLSNKTKKARKKLEKLQQQKNEAITTELNLDIVQDYIKQFLQGIEDKPLDEQRIIVKNIVKSIKWNGQESQIELYLDSIAPT